MFIPAIHGGQSSLQLIVDGNETNINIPLSNQDTRRNHWIPVEMTFDASRHKITVNVNGREFTERRLAFIPKQEVRIYFGRIPDSPITDVAGVSIRNLSLTADLGDQEFVWPLNIQSGNTIPEKGSKQVATVEFPEWLSPYHKVWEKIGSREAEPIPGIAFDAKRHRLMVVETDKLSYFDSDKKEWSIQRYSNDFPVSQNHIQAYFDIWKDSLIAYDLRHGKPYHFSKQKKEWLPKWHADSGLKLNYWHHLQMPDSASSQFYTFTGYGYFEYKNDLLRFDSERKKWINVPVSGDTLSPRSLSASGYIGNGKYLVFGGIGNKSGKQALGAKNLYDLYEIDLGKQTIKRLWTIPDNKIGQHFVPAHSLLVDKNHEYFYVLGYPQFKQNSELKLYRFSVNEPNFEIISEGIPYNFIDTRSSADLFFNTYNNEFLAVTRSENGNESSNIEIYSLRIPSIVTTIKENPKASEASLPWALLTIIGVALLVAIVTGFYISRFLKKKGISQQQKTNKEEQAETISEKTNSKEIQVPITTEKRNTIRLFGKFEMYNRDGFEITEKMTPKLRQIFLLMFLYPYTKGKGIGSSELTSTIWPESDDKKAKNTRSISIKRIRSILEEIEGVEIQFKNNQWIVITDDSLNCDFSKLLYIKEKIDRQKNKDTKNYETALLLSKQPLLPSAKFECLNDTKNFVISDLIRWLTDYAVKLDFKKDMDKLSDIADAIFNLDSLEDSALRIKLNVLVRKGGHSAAHSVYQRFNASYETLYNEPYPVPYQDLVS
ncbi:hypothetical protein [Fulvitalea axinellae]|uniref:hypothetical protein n=1 Tax=Fulvitalea axinellae TaxID=1182444 RepID=UPI0030CA449F